MMPDPKMVTERDAVLREREAFQRGASAVFDAFGIDPLGHRNSGEWKGSACIARSRYPLPKVTRARVVQDLKSNTSFRAVGGYIEALRAFPKQEWVRADTCGFLVTYDCVALWADLLANPTEEVEA